jgi:quercetin dioxygenase-like cupin family protein
MTLDSMQSKYRPTRMASTSKVVRKSLTSPDETLTFEKEKIEIVNLGNVTIARVTLEPGWSWEKHVKPRVNTKSCELPHTSLIVSGRAKTIMDDGTEIESGPGDVAAVPPGHNTWVLGDEPCVIIDFTGVEDWVKVHGAR